MGSLWGGLGVLRWFGVTVGWFWGHHGMGWAQRVVGWGHYGLFWGGYWGAIWGHYGVQFGADLRPFGADLCSFHTRLGGMGGRFGSHLGMTPTPPFTPHRPLYPPSPPQQLRAPSHGRRWLKSPAYGTHWDPLSSAVRHYDVIILPIATSQTRHCDVTPPPLPPFPTPRPPRRIGGRRLVDATPPVGCRRMAASVGGAGKPRPPFADHAHMSPAQ